MDIEIDHMSSSKTPPKVLYILGAPFSGTTLFSLALGTKSAFLNLGEVASLEHDYNDARKCTCGAQLSGCPFWGRLKARVTADQSALLPEIKWHFDNCARGEWLDERYVTKSFSYNFGILIGTQLVGLVPRKYLCSYTEKNRLFFESVHSEFPEFSYIVDCSKQAERLEALSRTQGIDLKVIMLKRGAQATFASAIKRLRKRRRPIFGKGEGFLQAAAYATWLTALNRRCIRVFHEFDVENRLLISFEDFMSHPRSVISDVERWLRLEPNHDHDHDPVNHVDYYITPSAQHIFVGNRWIFWEPDQPTMIEPRNDIATLTLPQRLAMKFAFRN